MTPDRWEQVKETFDAALKIGPDQRHAFLNEVCAEDADLRAAVESLLAAHNTPTAQELVNTFVQKIPCFGPSQAVKNASLT